MNVFLLNHLSKRKNCNYIFLFVMLVQVSLSIADSISYLKITVEWFYSRFLRSS